MITQLYLDLDGVFADFDQRVIELVGKHPRELPKKELWKVVYRDKHFFANLDMMPGAMDLWEAAKPFKPIFLTGAPSSDVFRAQKPVWVAEKFGPEWETIVLPRRDKQLYSKPGHVLIDDSEQNIEQWVSKGGIGILHTTAEKTITMLKQVHTEGYYYEVV